MKQFSNIFHGQTLNFTIVFQFTRVVFRLYFGITLVVILLYGCMPIFTPDFKFYHQITAYFV